MFVDHEEKKPIEIVVPDTSIHTVDYSWFFDQIAKGIQENIKVPKFVDGMTADFSTTTAVQKIIPQITMMNSVQDYFLYEMVLECGIPAVEMLGTEDDWSKLNTKRRALRTLLEPIEDDVDLSPEWWGLVERVFSNRTAVSRLGLFFCPNTRQFSREPSDKFVHVILAFAHVILLDAAVFR